MLRAQVDFWRRLNTKENYIFFYLKSGQDLENRAVHPHQEFPGAPPPPRGGILGKFSGLNLKSGSHLLALLHIIV